jgi:predicted transposase YbfD/YdcC
MGARGVVKFTHCWAARKKSPNVERRYYIMSLAGEAQAFGDAVRSHWGVENGLTLGPRHRFSRRCQSHTQGP